MKLLPNLFACLAFTLGASAASIPDGVTEIQSLDGIQEYRLDSNLSLIHI